MKNEPNEEWFEELASDKAKDERLSRPEKVEGGEVARPLDRKRFVEAATNIINPNNDQKFSTSQKLKGSKSKKV